jgi:hypothetical protein
LKESCEGKFLQDFTEEDDEDSACHIGWSGGAKLDRSRLFNQNTFEEVAVCRRWESVVGGNPRQFAAGGASTHAKIQSGFKKFPVLRSNIRRNNFVSAMLKKVE